MPEVRRKIVADWAQIVGTLIAIWTLLDPPKKWPALFSMLEIPATALWIIVVLLFSFTVLSGLSRLRRLESMGVDMGALQSEVASIKDGLAHQGGTSQSAAALPELKPLAPNELDDAAGTRWSWNGHEAQGPFCPRHGDRLKFVRHLGSNTVDSYSNFEEEYLGSSGWFGCPTDPKEELRIKEHMKVKTLRWRVSERFRAKYGLAPVEEPLTEEEREMLRLARENAQRRFPPFGSTRGSPPSTP